MHFARRLLVLFLFLLPFQLAAREPSHGVHGMVLFGGSEGLYASHLPLFHAPHDNQVVLKVRFADPALERAMRTRLDGKTALWTLEPEAFALHRLAPDSARPLENFRANVVEGHFEREGVTRERDAALVVEKVLLYRTLSPQPAVQTVARYLPVGRFLVKLVDSRPDFEHIVLLGRPAAGPVEVAKQGVEADLPALARQVPATGTVYYETADLR
ncbi:hypothetical protein [Massilia sp. Mn16-1_5]|uniref:hypothetical protein n=1 Tax=Massilia sp. Mn16-1_5 TaxID=2079199 RepID=UPI00109E64C4|nr:hypothetical protein [Massilia sp. Mn16-1_5]THC45300.1 hypothetical protein C2862_05855 [Massilia sp. Mn16-1_5]